MMHHTYTFSAKIWLYHGVGAWHFVTIPVDQGFIIRDVHALQRRGFGSLRVNATIGTTTWNTSIFPDKQSNSYLLPIKSNVRKKEQLQEGKAITITLLIEE